MTDQTPVKIAFLNDNHIVDILHTDTRLAAILLSSPTVVDVSSWYEVESNRHKVLNEARYNRSTGIFILPSPGEYYTYNVEENEWEPTPPSSSMPIEEGKYFVWNYETSVWDSYIKQEDNYIEPEAIESASLPPVKVAYIIDDVVVDVIYTDERLGSILLGSLTVLDITDKDNAGIGSAYDINTGLFSSIA